MRKHLLVVAYFFPPAGGAGVQRPLKFIKYLPRFGWECTVLTVADGCYFAEDPSLLADVPPSTRVVRTFSLEVERLRVLRTLRRRHSHTPPPDVVAGRRAGKRLSLLQRARKQLFVPDAQVGWVPFAIRAAMTLCKQQHVDAVWTTSSPYSAHLIGFALKRWLGLPHIADFRDPWTENAMDLIGHKPLQRRLEGAVVRQADRVVGVTPGIVNFLRDAYCPTTPDKFAVIPNGYDPADFSGVHRAPPAGPLRFVFTGAFYGKIEIGPFLLALSRFLQNTPAARRHVEVRLIGQFDRQTNLQYLELVDRLGLGANVDRLGYVSHHMSVRALQNAHVLLLPVFAGRGAAHHMPGKIFEYLAANRPILALADRGVAADLITEARAGVVVHPADLSGMERALAALWATYEAHGALPHTPDHAVIERFSRIHGAAKLADVLNGVLNTALADGDSAASQA